MRDGLALPVRDLTADAFALYGRVIHPPERAQDAQGPGWRWWAETVLLEGDQRPWGVGYLDLEPAPPPRFDWAERHMRTLEAVVPVSGDVIVYVAPAEHLDEPGRGPDLALYEAFRVTSGTGVVLERGVWHGAPLAAGAPAKAIVLILAGTGATDVTVVRFEDSPVHLELHEGNV
jgi:ureidoglycolate lyase